MRQTNDRAAPGARRADLHPAHDFSACQNLTSDEHAAFAMRQIARGAVAISAGPLLVACDEAPEKPKDSGPPYPSTYAAMPGQPTLIENAIILTGTGERIERGSVAFKDGRIVAVGDSVPAPEGAQQLAQAQVPVILDPLQDLPERFEQIGATLENAALLHAAGVTIEPGKLVDVVVWSGDPLEVTTFADQVLINGHVVPMESRQTLLRDRYMDLKDPLPPAYR